jgi:uncharacterized ion transporter superfamily protein YfcC
MTLSDLSQQELVGMTGSPSVSSEATSTTRKVTMIRALTILAAIVALAVSAAPVAPAASFSIDIGTTERLDVNGFKGKSKQGNGPSAMWDLKSNGKG